MAGDTVITLNLIDEMSPGVLKIGDEFLYVLLSLIHIYNVGAQYLAELNDFMPRGGIYANAGPYRFPVHICLLYTSRCV